jgi:hypothetical protein
VSEGSGRRHGQSSQHHRHQRTKRLLDYSGWSLSLPNLRKRLDARGLRHSVRRVAPGNHQGENSLQQPAGLGGVLIPLNDGAFATDAPPYSDPVRADVACLGLRSTFSRSTSRSRVCDLTRSNRRA